MRRIRHTNAWLRALPDCAARRGLSRREQEVWLLLARRRTNREISLQLNISLRTVEHHVGRVIAKFGVTNRREAGVVCLSHAAASDRFTNGCGGDWC
ncbi:MAG: helix-turn-helix transcriptional regulator [Thermomicrobiales bacterium]